MTDNTNITNGMNVADGVRDHPTDGSPDVHSGHTHQGWGGGLTRRWPTLLAIAFAVLVLFGLRVAFGLKSGSDFYFILFILALGYLVATALNLPWAPWVVLVLSIPAVLAMTLLGIEPAVVLLAVALFFVVLGFAHSRVQAPWGMPLQTAGVFAFGGLGLAAMFVAPALGVYLVAAGLIGHGVWDIVHYRANRVVARSYAEMCAVYDILLATAILIVIWV